MGKTTKSKTAEHSRNKDHQTQWNKTEIIPIEEDSIMRKLKQSVFITTTEDLIRQ
jgi:hypothetical protein